VLGGSLNFKRTMGSSSLNISESMVSIISKNLKEVPYLKVYLIFSK
jgi:hypothetical protein